MNDKEQDAIKLRVFKFVDGDDSTLFAVVVPDNGDINNDTNFNFFLTNKYAVINIGIDIYFTLFENINQI